MHRAIDIDDTYRLWAEERGERDALAVLLIMGANASGAAWPDSLLDGLAARHRAIRYDHRDTGRSTRAFSVRPCAIADLAGDAVAVLDAFDVPAAHVVGMSMGGTLTQLPPARPPRAAASATILGTTALGAGAADAAGSGSLPGPDPALLALWGRWGTPATRRRRCGGDSATGNS